MCTLNAFTAPSCGDSASIQRRGQLETGCAEQIPLPLRRLLRALPPIPTATAGKRRRRLGRLAGAAAATKRAALTLRNLLETGPVPMQQIITLESLKL